MLSSPVLIRPSGRCGRAASHLRRLGLPCLLVLMIVGCASGKPQRVSLVPVATTETASAVHLSRDVDAVLPSGAPVTLSSGSPWRRTGAIVQGDVYRSLGSVFTIPLPRQTEACLVASSGKLVGFYLPVDGTYIELPRPVTLPIPQPRM